MPLKIFIEKVPFIEYLSRLLVYIIKPEIKEYSLDKNPLRYALADIFLSIGFISTITAYLIIFRPKYKYLSFIKAINPEPIIINFLLGGIVTSSAFCIIAMLITFFKKRISGDTFLKKSYYLWLHSLRFYAVLTVFIYSIFIHAIGLVVNDGKLLKDHIAEHLTTYWAVLIVMGILIFRLFINPAWRYLSIFKSKLLSGTVFLLSLCSHLLPIVCGHL